MEHGYYVGLDIDDSNVVVSVFQPGMKEPETISTIAGSEVFQIPLLLMKKSGIGQWFIGEDAKKIATEQGEEPLSELLSKALSSEMIVLEEEEFKANELLTLYIRKVLLIAVRFGEQVLPDKLVITVEELSQEMIKLFASVCEGLGMDKGNLTLLDRKEAFYYFALNQKPDLWLHDVYLFDYRREDMICCHLKRNQKTVPQLITLDSKVKKMLPPKDDGFFYQVLLECFRGNVVSSVYLVGDGFEGNWMKKSLSYMCQGRHAFMGKNLYSKGACYAAIVARDAENWHYAYLGDNEMKVNVSLKVSNRRNPEFLTLISAGDNRYETERSCEVLLDGTPEIAFWLQSPHSKEAKVEKLKLADLPERKNKTTRLRIVAKPVSDTKVQIKIRDMGFGEIVKSSEKTWEYIMSL